MSEKQISQELYDWFQNRIWEERKVCGFCKHAVDNRDMYYSSVCMKYEKPIVVNNDYSTCENFEKR